MQRQPRWSIAWTLLCLLPSCRGKGARTVTSPPPSPQSLRDSVAQRKAETDREIRRRERLEREMKDLVRRGGQGTGIEPGGGLLASTEQKGQ